MSLEDESCRHCRMELLPWRDTLFCVVCDGRDDPIPATWFEAFASSEGST